MKKSLFGIFIATVVLTSLISCSGKSNKKRNLDETLYKYAALIRWSNFDDATILLKSGEDIKSPGQFQLQRLKQFKISRYLESPIQPGKQENIVLQNVEIHYYNIHTNISKTINDHQSWEYNDELGQWYLTTGLPKL